MDILKDIRDVYAAIEGNRASQAVYMCLRLARITEDIWNTVLFLREVASEENDYERSFAQETATLGEDEVRELFKRTMAVWCEERGANIIDDDGDTSTRRIYTRSVGMLESELQQAEKSIEDATTPLGLHPYDAEIREQSNVRMRSFYRQHIKTLIDIRERIKYRCMDYAITIEKQLLNQDRQRSFVEVCQQKVDNYFKMHHEDTFRQLQKAQELVFTSDVENAALALTSVRRALKSAADCFYPARDEPVDCADGVSRTMEDRRYINRLLQYIAESRADGSSLDLLRAETEYVANYVKRLNDIASKGVHATVSFEEARQALVSVYLLFSNIISDAPPKVDSLRSGPAVAAPGQ